MAPGLPPDGPARGGRLGALATLRRALATRRPSSPSEEATRTALPPPSQWPTDAPPAPGFRPQTAIPRRRPTPIIAGLAAAACAVALVGGLTYYAARTFTSRAAEARGSQEAISFAQHSSTLATGDAFMGYLQILRYAEDNVLRARIATVEQREAVLQQQIYLNTNRMYALAVADRTGRVLASVGMELTDLRGSEAFERTRASQGPANSDIVLPESGVSGYVEYTAVLVDPADGAEWGVLYGRANPAVLWRGTLVASIDRSRNVIINQRGQFAAGVSSDLVGQPWSGVPLADGGVRARIDGVDSICGLGTVGAGTQIDRGWAVASCLPASLISAQADAALGDLGMVVLAGSVLAIVLAGSLLRLMLGDPGEAAAAMRPVIVEAAHEDDDPVVADVGAHSATALSAEDEELAPVSEAESAVGAEETVSGEDPPELDGGPAAAEGPAAPVVQAHVDALALIDAYETRNARLAEELRERLAAPLMIAASQAADAFRAATAHHDQAADSAAADAEDAVEADDDRRMDAVDIAPARARHEAAMDELETLRQRVVRSITTELHPGLVRLGLPSALRSLLSEFGRDLTVTLDLDPDTDSRDGGAGRPVVDDARRLLVYRAAREAIAAARAAGAEACNVTLRRNGEVLLLIAETPAAFDEGVFTATRISAEAYGGACAVASAGEGRRMTLVLPSPALHAVRANDAEVDGEDGAPRVSIGRAAAGTRPIVSIPAELRTDEGDLRTALESFARELPDFEVGIDIDAALDGDGAPDAELAGALRTLAVSALTALREAGAIAATVWVRRIRDDVFETITADGAVLERVASPAFEGARLVIERRGGSVTVSNADQATSIAAESPLAPTDGAEVKVVRIDRAPIPPDADEPAA